MNFKKYVIEDHSDGKKYEVITDELGYIHDKQPIEPLSGSIKPDPEVKPVSFEQIKRLYDKEFPEPITKPVNEVKKLHKMLNDK